MTPLCLHLAPAGLATWREIEAEPASGPFVVRRSRLGAVWVVEDTRTGTVRAAGLPDAESLRRADTLNRMEAL